MFRKYSPRNSLEVLEARIAPATIVGIGPGSGNGTTTVTPTAPPANLATADAAGHLYPTIAQAEAMPNGAGFVTAEPGTPVLVHAGQVLNTGVGAQSGQYLLFVQQGEAEVFFTDLNNNGVIDPNEITGIAASDGLRLISFVDIHGDIVTNLLKPTGQLSDSHNNAALSNSALGGDGRVLLNNSIELVEFRTLTQADLTPGENLSLRLAPTAYSLYGNIIAGKGFGTTNGGLIIDNSQAANLATVLNQSQPAFQNSGEGTVGGIYTGSAASGLFINFGPSRGDDQHPSGALARFIPPAGQSGGDIMNIGATISSTGVVLPGFNQATKTLNAGVKAAFNLGIAHAGDGGIGARGGNIVNATISSDDAGGYSLIAGNGGGGPFGGQGGSVLNYSDLGSITGQVTVQSGNGGVGSTGAGGAGGTVTFGSITIAAGLTVNLGSGGDGFTSGGAGSSLPSGSLVTQSFTIAPNATVVVSTTHANGSIGTTIPIDFNGDGAGDVVYATQNPSQLVVLLGDALNPGLFNQRIYLPMPYTGVDAIAVGDLLGNGHLDVAAVTGNATVSPGIAVFTGTTDTKGAFTGFSSARYSPLPDLFSGDPTQGLQFGYLHANAPINQIVVGNFAGDGRVGIAVAATYYFPVPVDPTPRQVVMFLKPDLAPDGKVLPNGTPEMAPNGLFYADFGTTGAAPNPFVPFLDIGGGTASYLEATALSINATSDHVVGIPAGGKKALDVIGNVNPSPLGPTLSTIGLGKVDTDRTQNSAGKTDHQTLVDAVAGHFAILDFTNPADATHPKPFQDGNADFSVLLQSPAGFMVNLRGNGTGGGTTISGVGDNSGTFFGGDGTNGFHIGTNQVLIRAANLDSGTPNGNPFDDVAVLDYDQGTFNGALYAIVELRPTDKGNAAFVPNPGAVRIGTAISTIAAADDPTVHAFDVYTPTVANTSAVDFITALPDTNPRHIQALEVLPAGAGLVTFVPEVLNFFHINGGNGGNGLVGAGGAGGNLGNALSAVKTTVAGVTTTTILGSLNITLPFDLTFAGDVKLMAGTGGNGFTTGGQGGNVTGTTVSYGITASGIGLTPVQVLAGTVLETVELIGGNGGLGVSGAGGNGGNLTANAIDFGQQFVAGAGGTGAFGGNGGSVIGNGRAGFYDTFDTVVEVTAGLGADGVKAGGNGGSVVNFRPSFNLPIIGGATGIYSVVAGDGGNASSGKGGDGGSVINVSPLNSLANNGNFMAGDIVLQGGHGGNGSTGGGGGAVSKFVDQPSNNITPAILSILGGTGGKGVSGPGGNGGAISSINVPSTGQPSTALLPNLTLFNFDRIIAGNGGSSSGYVGGAGGGISNLQTSNTKSGFAIIAGEGGAGLYAGGAGGSVTNNFVQIGGKGGGPDTTLTKALVIAGAGGNATAWLPSNASDATKAFGGRVGSGGAGGNINGFTQSGGTFVNVDFIAGNGGDTINNFGVVAGNNFFVGKGGSVSSLNVTGEIGNTDTYSLTHPTPTPLKSYNDIVHGQTIANFVDQTFVNNPFAPLTTLDDNLGSVGIVVGASGRLKAAFTGYDSNNMPIYESQPSTGGVNGSLTNVFANGGIESAVAGSIDRIATITAVQDVTIGHGVVGTIKIAGSLGYLSADGTPLAAPVVGGKLIDGALVSASVPTAFSTVLGREVPTTIPGNVFVLL